MIKLTSDEHDLREFLIGLARSASDHNLAASPRILQHNGVTMAYHQIAEQRDPDGALGWNDGGHYKRLTTALYHINNYELEHGRPMVGAFAVSKNHPYTSGGGFAGMASEAGLEAPGKDDPDGQTEFWREQLTASAEYWSEHADGDTALSDAQFDAIMTELSTIKQMLRSLLHG